MLDNDLSSDISLLFSVFNLSYKEGNDEHKLARLLGSREELVAYILLCQPGFCDIDAIKNTLAATASLAPRVNRKVEDNGLLTRNKSGDSESVVQLRESVGELLGLDSLIVKINDQIEFTLKDIFFRTLGRNGKFTDCVKPR